MRACSHLILPIMNHRKGPNTPISHHYPPFLAPPPPHPKQLYSKAYPCPCGLKVVTAASVCHVVLVFLH